VRCVGGGGGQPRAVARTSVTSRGGALPVMWLEAGRSKAGQGGGGNVRVPGKGGNARGERTASEGGTWAREWEPRGGGGADERP
jgi:hypothetical protein